VTFKVHSASLLPPSSISHSTYIMAVFERSLSIWSIILQMTQWDLEIFSDFTSDT
jgi:hypothetical protein